MSLINREISADAIALSLRQSPLFAQINYREIAMVAEISTIRRFRRGTTIYSEGMPVSAFYILQSGIVKISHVDVEGNEQVLKTAGAPSAFGEESLLSQDGYVSDAAAVDNCSTIVVPRADFLYLLKHNPALCTAVLRSVGQHFDALVRALGDRKLHNVATRVGNWLLEHCREQSGPQQINLPSSKGLLASELGIASETLSRTLKVFSTHALLEVRGRRFLVPNPGRLRGFLRSPESYSGKERTTVLAA